MPLKAKRTNGLLLQMWDRLKRLWIKDVPEDIALCEFDCRKEQCHYDEWASCERRLTKAAGELMPASADGIVSEQPHSAQETTQGSE